MRKTLIQTLLAAFCAILATAPLEGGGVMLIGMRYEMRSGKGMPTARDYVQDGLVAVYDGIENAGWGVHDPNATVWKDLTGNGWDFPATNLTFHDDRVEVLAYVASVKSSADFWNWTGGTVDGTFERPTTTAKNNGFLAFGRLGIVSINTNSVNGCMWYTSASASNWRCLYPFGRASSSPGARAFEKAHRAFASDFTQSYANQRYYQNGVRYIGYDETWTQNVAHSALTPSLSVGTVGTPKFYGLRIYSRALTADEVAVNYTIDKARFNLP